MMTKRLLAIILTICVMGGVMPAFDVFALNDDGYIYLSDINYLEKTDNFVGSTAGWGSIKKDENIEGGAISVFLDGVATTFDKGMAAHATSAIYYDISGYSEYTRFSAYVGINSTKTSGSGDGVSFVISVSDNLKDWTPVYTVAKISAGEDAVFVDVNLGGAKYLKLYSDKLGNNSYDHSVYADARLLKSTYNVSDDTPSAFKKPAEYNEKIMSDYEKLGENEALSDTLKRDILLRTFTARYGYYAIQRKARSSSSNKEAIEYIYNNTNVLKYFVMGGVKDRDSGTYSDSLDAWCSLYSAYKSDFSGSDGDMYLKLAVSLSIAYARSINYWVGSTRNSVPTERYAEFKYLITNGYFDKASGWSKEQFAALPIELMRLAVNSEIHEDEMVWLADWALKKGNGSVPTLSAYSFITYTFLQDYSYSKKGYPQFYDLSNYDTYNEKWGLDKMYLHASDNTDKSPLVSFGTENHPRLWMMFEAGSVCGGLAGTYEVLNEVYGIPAELINQPGHAATFVYGENDNGDGVWKIQNDVSNWKDSKEYNTFTPLKWNARDKVNYGYDGSFILLAQRAFNENEKLEDAMYYKYLADVYIAEENDVKLLDIYKKLLKIQPYNYDGILGVIDNMESINPSVYDYMKLAKHIVEQYTYYPLPMLDALKCIESKVETDPVAKVNFDTLRRTALEKASVATDSNSIQAAAVRDVAGKYLGKESEPFTFSFDGENAGKIVLSDNYAGSGVTWCYTLGGADLLDESLNPDKTGVVTVQTNEATLTSEEIKSISAENDICIYIVGANTTIYTIDITEGVAPTTKTLYGNDWENRFAGNSDCLEWHELGNAEWNDYTDETIFTGDKTIVVRYKANGTCLASGTAEYTFTEDTDTPECKYIPVSALKLDGYSSQQSVSDAAIHLIDGNMNTRWHNTWSGENNKYYAVEFDKERCITKIDYYPDEGGVNGQFKSGEIYITDDSSDEWSLVGSFTGFDTSKNVKTITLSSPVRCKKIKLVLTETYGSTVNVFACGRMLNFYEDATYGGNVGWSVTRHGNTVTAESLGSIESGKKITVTVAKFSNKNGDTVLSGCDTKSFNTVSGQSTYSVSFDNDINISNDEFVRIFLWDENMKPLTIA